MTLIKVITNEVGKLEDHKHISSNFLEGLGYIFTDREIIIGRKPAQYVVREVANSDNKKEVPFCFLYSPNEKKGLILSREFEFYVKYIN